MADRISTLPDEVLRQILSLIPEEEVPQKLILSKAWKRIVFSLTSVKIIFAVTPESEEALESFINGYLLHSGEPLTLKKVVLHCRDFQSMGPITRMIQVAVINRRVQSLEVKCEYEEELDYFILPQAVFTSPFLKSLTIKDVIVQPPAGPIFEALETLEVDVSMHCPTSLQNFYFQCQRLEDLTFVGEVFMFPFEDHVRRFQVYSGSLKRLTLKIEAVDAMGMGGHGNKGANGNYDLYTFVINTPSLEILRIDEEILASYQVLNLSSLVEASVQLGWRDVGYRIPDHVNDIFPLIAGLTNVQKLELGDRTLGVVGRLFDHLYVQAEDEELWARFRATLPIFPLLKTLTLSISHRSGWRVLVFLLDRTPELESLVIESVVSEHVTQHSMFAWDAPGYIPRCLTHCIMELELRGIAGDERFLPVVNYFQDISNTMRQFEITITET